MKFIPKDYQRRAAEHILRWSHCGLFLEPGLGKTICTASALRNLINQLRVRRVLVVAPKRVAISTWPDEFRKWDHLRDMTFTVITGTATERRVAVSRQTDFHFINYENLAWLVKHCGKDWSYDVVVLDESSKMKNRSSVRWKALRKQLGSIRRVILLTGTPAANGLIDLWGQVYLLDQGHRLGRTLTAFRERWFTEVQHSWVPLASAQREIPERVSDICLSMTAEEYLNLPDIVNNYIFVDLDEDSRNFYDRMEADLALEVRGTEITALNAASMSMKCRQIANGALYDEHHDWHQIHDAKLDALEDLIEELAGQPLLVAYQFRSDLERLQKRFPEGRTLDENPTTIQEWNSGNIHILFTHPASCGHGLNLQHGGHHAVWFGIDWSLELYQQFCARLHRLGQKSAVFIHHIIARGTVDEAILDRLENKRSVQDALMEYLQR